MDTVSSGKNLNLKSVDLDYSMSVLPVPVDLAFDLSENETTRLNNL